MDASKLTQDRIKANIKISASGCWEWQLYIRRNGYGQMKHDGKTVDAHRVSYRCFHGEIPEGMCICHRCDNKRCCNPDHLFLGTYSDNMTDYRKKGNRTGPKRKMTPELVKEARDLRVMGFTYKQIGEQIGVTAMAVWMHLNAPANDNAPHESASYIPRSKSVQAE